MPKCRSPPRARRSPSTRRSRDSEGASKRSGSGDRSLRRAAPQPRRLRRACRDARGRATRRSAPPRSPFLPRSSPTGGRSRGGGRRWGPRSRNGARPKTKPGSSPRKPSSSRTPRSPPSTACVKSAEIGRIPSRWRGRRRPKAHGSRREKPRGTRADSGPCSGSGRPNAPRWRRCSEPSCRRRGTSRKPSASSRNAGTSSEATVSPKIFFGSRLSGPRTAVSSRVPRRSGRLSSSRASSWTGAWPTRGRRRRSPSVNERSG